MSEKIKKPELTGNKCYMCNSLCYTDHQIQQNNYEIYFCALRCCLKFNEINEVKKSAQEFEEIKQIALMVYKSIITEKTYMENFSDSSNDLTCACNDAWIAAEQFYKFAKEKEGKERCLMNYV